MGPGSAGEFETKVGNTIHFDTDSYSLNAEAQGILQQQAAWLQKYPQHMAHVYGHCDFFKNNYYFSKTNRRMIDGMANHATRVRRHIERLGIEKVESFIDSCLCLENLIDPMSPFIARKAAATSDKTKQAGQGAGKEEAAPEIPRIRAKSYMNPPVDPRSDSRKSVKTARTAPSASTPPAAAPPDLRFAPR